MLVFRVLRGKTAPEASECLPGSHCPTGQPSRNTIGLLCVALARCSLSLAETTPSNVPTTKLEIVLMRVSGGLKNV